MHIFLSNSCMHVSSSAIKSLRKADKVEKDPLVLQLLAVELVKIEVIEANKEMRCVFKATYKK